MSRSVSLSCAVAAAVALTLRCGAAEAEATWPTKPLQFVIGYPVGSSPDTMGRLLAEPLANTLGQPVVIINEPGAGGVIGVQRMLIEDPAYTFAITTNGPLTTSPRLVPYLPYDVDEDIAPIALIGTSPLILTVNTRADPDTLEEFIEWAHAKPGGIKYGSIGTGSGSHLTAELFAATAGVEMLHVPFASFSEVTNSILGQEIDMAFMAPSGALAAYRAGNLKILGITAAEPSPLAPDVPTIAGNAGLPETFRAELWIAAVGSSDAQPDVIARLNAEIVKILGSDEVKQKMLEVGWRAEGGSPDSLSDRITKDSAVWGAALEKAGLVK